MTQQIFKCQCDSYHLSINSILEVMQALLILYCTNLHDSPDTAVHHTRRAFAILFLPWHG